MEDRVETEARDLPMVCGHCWCVVNEGGEVLRIATGREVWNYFRRGILAADVPPIARYGECQETLALYPEPEAEAFWNECVEAGWITVE